MPRWEQARSTYYNRRERAQRLSQAITPGKKAQSLYVSTRSFSTSFGAVWSPLPSSMKATARCLGTCASGIGNKCLAIEGSGSRGRTIYCRLTVDGRTPRSPDETIVTEAPNLMWGTDQTKESERVSRADHPQR